MTGTHVDVVIPLYNKAGVIGRAVSSVVAQTHESWTLHLVDDGSTDEWMLTFDDPRIKVVRQPNAGPGAARNAGAQSGTAAFIAFLDADDEWLPGYLEHLVAILEQDATLAAASSSWFRGAERHDVNEKFLKRGIGAGRWEWTDSTPVRVFKMRVDSLHSSATMVRRSVFERLGGFYENRSTFGEDSYLWTNVALTQPVFRSWMPLLRFHIDASSLSVGRTGAYPLPPILTDPARIRSSAGPRWDQYMTRYFAYYVPLILGRSIDEGAPGQAFAFIAGGGLAAMGVTLRARWRIRLRVIGIAVRRPLRRLRVAANRRSGTAA